VNGSEWIEFPPKEFSIGFEDEPISEESSGGAQ
jgi:hypothetical protein